MGFYRVVLFCVCYISFCFLVSCVENNSQPPVRNMVVVDTVPVKEPQKLYGFCIDSFDIVKNRVKWNQNLSDIITKYNITNKQVYELSQKSKSVFDVRKFRKGHKYYLFLDKDSGQTLKHMVYEHNSLEYVTINFVDTVDIFKTEKEIVSVMKADSGEVKTSLWNTMVENSINPVMSMELSEVYAWSIDFFGLKKGDKFKVIYDEKFVDSVSIGIGKIHMVLFEHMGESYYAFNFPQDGRQNFFDEEGKSLRKAFLKAPLKFSRVSSGFSYSRMHPILHYRRPHTGVDYAAPSGTPVYAIGDGIVCKKGRTKGAGNYVQVKHNSVYRTGYNHFSKFAKGIKVGTKVKQGQVIGYVGKTGYATGPHLDFRFWKNNKPCDPLKVKAPPVEPIKDSLKVDYQKHVELWLGLLKYV